MNTLFLDCETFSEVELKTRGTYVYTEACGVMLLSYAWNDEPVECVDLTAGQPLPDFSKAERVVAHNAMFDRLATKKILDIPIELWFCSMVQALSHGLPGSLDELCEIYRISDDKAKIKDGRRLIQLFCKPRKTKNGLIRNTRETHPEEWARFIEYAKNDIEAMREIHKKLPRWNYPRQPELALWHLDQVINDRGVMIDREMGEAAIRAIKRAQASLSEQTADMTGGGLESTTQVAAMIQFIFEEYGVHFNDLTKAQVSKAIDDPDIPEPVKDLLRVRQQASSSSTAKYKALLNRANDDDRFRGGLQFAGASRTLRCSGRGFQPQNLPSRGLLPDNLIEHGIELMKCDAEDLVFPNVMHLASSAIRRVLIAAPGKKFCISDLSNIEGRKVAWYAGEAWKLQAFRDFDGGTGHDLYNLAYARAFNIPVENVTKDQRSIGKVLELFLSYGGGCGAFVTGAAGYGFNLEKLADRIFDTLPNDAIREATEFLEWWSKQKRDKYGLSDKAFITVDVLKRLWRRSNAKITQLWPDVQRAAQYAVTTGDTAEVGLLKFDKKGAWLRVHLASGRFLCYPFAEFDNDEGLSYYGVDQYTRKWQKIRTHGSKIVENICQSSARCVLYDSMPIAEAAGFPIVLHVHDELVTETEQDKHVEELSAIMAAGHPWTEGLPLAAAGFESLRYKK